MKSRKVRWVRDIARMGAISNEDKVWSGKLNGTEHLRDLSLTGRIILKCISMKKYWGV
jgi:hypothetical protein